MTTSDQSNVFFIKFIFNSLIQTYILHGLIKETFKYAFFLWLSFISFVTIALCAFYTASPRKSTQIRC